MLKKKFLSMLFMNYLMGVTSKMSLAFLFMWEDRLHVNHIVYVNHMFFDMSRLTVVTWQCFYFSSGSKSRLVESLKVSIQNLPKYKIFWSRSRRPCPHRPHPDGPLPWRAEKPLPHRPPRMVPSHDALKSLSPITTTAAQTPRLDALWGWCRARPCSRPIPGWPHPTSRWGPFPLTRQRSNPICVPIQRPLARPLRSRPHRPHFDWMVTLSAR